MASIRDIDRIVFKDAAAITLDNFTLEEQERITALASDLRELLIAAKQRDQQRFTKP